MRSGIVLALFTMVLLFQLSMIKYVLGIGGVATVANSLMLLVLSIIAVKIIAGGAFSQSVWGFYLLPGALVFIGFFLNVSLNLVANLGVVSYFGLLIPWAAYLSVPFFIPRVIDSETVWRYFYRFMFVICVATFLESFLVASGILSLRIIETHLATFLSGGLTVLLMLKDETAHYRLYGIFPEPGTFAMYLLPVIMYALVYRKYLGLIVFAVALVLTDSLGGFMSLILLVLLYAFIRMRRAKLSFGVSIIPSVLLAVALIGFVASDFSKTYSSKGESAEVRESNFSDVITKMPLLLLNHPLGLTLAEGTLSDIDDKEYYGSSFALGTAHAIGGDLAFLGYLLVLVVCLVVSFASIRKGLDDIDHRVIFPSLLALLPFVVQRATVMDSAAFAFLFAPSIVRHLQVSRARSEAATIAGPLDKAV